MQSAESISFANRVTVSTDAEAFNRIANDPSVLPWVSLDGEIDLTETLADQRNVGFLGDGCAFIANYIETSVYEVHSLALPAARGQVIYAAAEAIRTMFIATPALELLTRVPDANTAARGLTMKSGFTPEFDRKAAWGAQDVHFYALRYPEWIKRQDWLRASGEWFHDLIGGGDHENDPVHDIRVGACAEMVKAAQAIKGVTLYNRWAVFAGYMPIEIESFDPLIIDIISHRIKFADGAAEVL